MFVDKDNDELKDSQQGLSEVHEEQLEGYNFIKTLGKGNFGKVQLGMHVLTGEYVAIKILEKDLIFEKADIERISREIKIMKLIRHPNIIQLYEIIEKPKRLYLIMEYAEGGDLFDMIVKNERLIQKKAANCFAQIILGLEYLHSKGVVHRDMKPQNILISGQKIKIADFGLGNFFNQGQMLKTACGSPCYASPQMLQRIPYDPEAVDVWSSGIILYAMLCGYLPFEDQVTTKLYQKIKNNNPRLPKFLREEVKNILKRLLDKNPQTRLKIPQIKQEPWMKGEFQAASISQFEVDPKKLNTICHIYGINDKEKLANYLRKNKHNNLTTIYYLAGKNKLQDIDDQNLIQEQEIYQEEQFEQSTREQSNPENQKVQQLIENQDAPHSNETLQEFKPNVGQQSEKQIQHSKSGSIKNDISFSQLESFSNNNLHEEKTLQEQKSNVQQQKIQIQVTDQHNNKIQGQKKYQQCKEENIGQLTKQDFEIIEKSIQSNSEDKKGEINQTVDLKQYETTAFTRQTQIDKKQQLNTEQNKKPTQSQENIASNEIQGKDKPKSQQTIRKQDQKGPNKKHPIVLTKKQSSKEQAIGLKSSQTESKSFLKTKKSLKEEKPNILHEIGKDKQSKNLAIKTSENGGVKMNLNSSVRMTPSNFSKKIDKNKIHQQMEKQYKEPSKKHNKSVIETYNKSINENEPIKDLEKKSKLIKTGRMEIIRPAPTDTNRKAPPLYERSHSRDKNITTKKIVGKPVNSQPFLIDPSRVVLCSWQKFNSILTQKGAEGRIQFFNYGKNCIYISKSSIKGIRSLKQIVQRINLGQLS